MIITLLRNFITHNRYALLEITDESFNSRSRDNVFKQK